MYIPNELNRVVYQKAAEQREMEISLIRNGSVDIHENDQKYALSPEKKAGPARTL